MANARKLLVINDEAHHAWRTPGDFTSTGREAGPNGSRRPSGSAALTGIARTTWDPDLLRLFGDTVRADGRAKFRGVAVRLDRERLWAERRDRGRTGEDAAGGGSRRRFAGHADIQVPPLSHLQRPQGQARPEPPRPDRRSTAGPGAERLLPAGVRLARRLPEAWAEGGGRDAARDDHGGQSHRNGGAREARLRHRAGAY